MTTTINSIYDFSVNVKNYIADYFSTQSIAWEINRLPEAESELEKATAAVAVATAELETAKTEGDAEEAKAVKAIAQAEAAAKEAFKIKEEFFNNERKAVKDPYDSLWESKVHTLIEEQNGYNNAIHSYYKTIRKGDPNPKRQASIDYYQEHFANDIQDFKKKVKILESKISKAKAEVESSPEAKAFASVDEKYDELSHRYYELKYAIDPLKENLESIKYKNSDIYWKFNNKLSEAKRAEADSKREVERLKEKIQRVEFENSLIPRKNEIYGQFMELCENYFSMVFKHIERYNYLENNMSTDAELEEAAELEETIQSEYKLTREKKAISKALYIILDRCKNSEELNKDFAHWLNKAYHNMD